MLDRDRDEGEGPERAVDEEHAHRPGGVEPPPGPPQEEEGQRAERQGLIDPPLEEGTAHEDDVAVLDQEHEDGLENEREDDEDDDLGAVAQMLPGAVEEVQDELAGEDPVGDGGQDALLMGEGAGLLRGGGPIVGHGGPPRGQVPLHEVPDDEPDDVTVHQLRAGADRGDGGRGDVQFLLGGLEGEECAGELRADQGGEET